MAGALAVLHAWDAARARGLAADDPSALRALYLPGSSAGRADVALLASYRARGVEIAHVREQRFAIEVMRRAPATLAVRVLERVVGWVRSGGRRITLPGEAATWRRITFRRDGTGLWRVASLSRARG